MHKQFSFLRALNPRSRAILKWKTEEAQRSKAEFFPNERQLGIGKGDSLLLLLLPHLFIIECFERIPCLALIFSRKVGAPDRDGQLEERQECGQQNWTWKIINCRGENHQSQFQTEDQIPCQTCFFFSSVSVLFHGASPFWATFPPCHQVHSSPGRHG